MFKKFYPDQLAESVYHIPFKTLYKEGTRGVIFDIDNTLVPHDLEADEKIITFIKHLKAVGLEICLLSNNKEIRVCDFAKAVNVPYIFNGKKPLVKNYKKAMEIMGTDQQHTVFVGDQIFTDILGANRAGVLSILVSPIHPREEIQIVLKRYLETVVLHFYRKQAKNKANSKK